MFTRLALMVLTGMSGRLLRRPRARARRRETATSTATRLHGESTGAASTGPAQTGAPLSPTAAPTQSTPQVATIVGPPEEQVRRLRPRTRAPLVAAIGARSLPLLGLLGTLITAILAAGAISGELPYIGAVESANPAWATLLVTISLWAVYLLWKVPQWQADAWARSGNASPREVFEIEN
jgi:hypothetical protein